MKLSFVTHYVSLCCLTLDKAPLSVVNNWSYVPDSHHDILTLLEWYTSFYTEQVLDPFEDYCT